MQPWPLTVDRVLDHAAHWHPRAEVVSRELDGSVRRRSYLEIHRTAKRVSNALRAAGIGAGDRVATLAMNSGRHFETWYGIMGIGAICHTLNPRLFDDQLTYIINHAGDRCLFSDAAFAPLVARLLPQCPTVERVIFYTPPLPPVELARPHFVYDTVVADQTEECTWGDFGEETAAGLCYTSGTTGHPKGVMYSHRSNVLHTLMTMGVDGFGFGASDVVLAIVPLFHANAWGLVFSAPTVGARLVMPGAHLDGASVHDLIEREAVTFSAGVPTVWQGLLQHLDATGGKLSTLRRALIGGAACPPVLIRRFQDDYGVEVVHAWGMTEMSPVGVVGSLTPEAHALPPDERFALRTKQGRVPFGVDMKLTDDAGHPVPHDGKAYGRLKVRGPAVSRAYFGREDEPVLDAEGFFDTGDVATIDPLGFMQITDRAKDLIKSGGEWISSIEIENLVTAHPAVLIAAVIGVPDPKWDERPLLVVVPKEGHQPMTQDVLEFLKPKIAKWWMPDDMQVVKEIPHTATGKINKLKLRETFKGYKLPTT